MISRLSYFIGDCRLYLRYRIACRAKGETPQGFREFRRELRELFLTIRKNWNPQTHAQFHIAVRKLTGDCK
jgi:hypothetical protein